LQPESTVLVAITDVVLITNVYNNTHILNVLRPFVRDYPGDPVPEETLTYPPS